MKQWLKYYYIRTISFLTCTTVVNCFGSTYVVYGNVVQKVRL